MNGIELFEKLVDMRESTIGEQSVCLKQSLESRPTSKDNESVKCTIYRYPSFLPVLRAYCHSQTNSIQNNYGIVIPPVSSVRAAVIEKE